MYGRHELNWNVDGLPIYLHGSILHRARPEANIIIIIIIVVIIIANAFQHSHTWMPVDAQTSLSAAVQASRKENILMGK